MDISFCPDCDNLLYVYTSSDKSLYYGCKYCKYNSKKEGEIIETNCVYNTKQDISGLDLIKNNSYLNYDITIPSINSHKNFKCPNTLCQDKKHKIKYINFDNKNMKFLYICENCNSQWTNK